MRLTSIGTTCQNCGHRIRKLHGRWYHAESFLPWNMDGDSPDEYRDKLTRKCKDKVNKYTKCNCRNPYPIIKVKNRRLFQELIIKIRRMFSFWERISNVPVWVHRASDNWKMGLQHRPYDRIKHFVGKNYIYKIHYKTITQGQIQEIYYRKTRIK